MSPDYRQFEKIAELRFNNIDLLAQAFTHRSYINEHRELPLLHNERLEFLGDAVLELIITDFLYTKYPHKTEGDLTSYRAALVNAVTLSEVSRKLNMNQYLRLSRGEAKDTGRARDTILANTFEALIGAIYLDQGYDVAREFISKHLFHIIDEVVDKKLWLDAKSHFQEKAQQYEGITPEYRTIGEEGPDHDKYFTVGVFLREDEVANGRGRSKQEAEQEAARKALEAKGWG